MTSSDPRQTMSLFGGYIDEVQHVFRDNNLDFGSPFDFRIFAKSLKKDPVLREDLAVLTRSIMERENNISLRTVLNILAIASGGPDLDTSDSEMSQPVNLLSDFLLKVTGGSQTIVQDSDVSDFKPIEEPSPQVVLLASPSSDIETPADDQSTLEAVTPRSDDDQIGELPQPDQFPPSPSANPYAESLTRLELNSLQVKHYLDSIDQRISRIEPRLDGLPANPVPAAMPQSNLAAGGKYSAAMMSEGLADPPQDESQPLEVPPMPASKSAEVLSGLREDLDQDPSGVQLAIPVIAGIGAVAVVLISLVYWTFQREVPSKTIHSASPRVADNTATPPPNRAPATSENPSSPSENATLSPSQSHAVATKNPSATVDHSSSSTSSPIRHRISPPASSTVNAKTQPTTHPAATPVVTGSATDLPTSAAPSEGSETSTGSINSTGRIHVSAGMMSANVLSAPQPAYPKLALLTHMQGEVVMQAIIATDGSIESVRVLKGHRLLRGAATSAVKNWRYRPVVVDGHPVEVATIVSVTFTLP